MDSKEESKLLKFIPWEHQCVLINKITYKLI